MNPETREYLRAHQTKNFNEKYGDLLDGVDDFSELERQRQHVEALRAYDPEASLPGPRLSPYGVDVKPFYRAPTYIFPAPDIYPGFVMLVAHRNALLLETLPYALPLLMGLVEVVFVIIHPLTSIFLTAFMTAAGLATMALSIGGAALVRKRGEMSTLIPEGWGQVTSPSRELDHWLHGYAMKGFMVDGEVERESYQSLPGWRA